MEQSGSVTSTVPAPDETDRYYHRYIELVARGDVLDTLEEQMQEVLELLQTVSESQSLHRYAPGKWSMRDVLAHITDTERAFAFRALWFARGFDTPLPGYDQDVAAATAGADARSWRSHLEEFATVRAATITLFRGLPAEAWLRRGVADGKPFSVRALAYINAGHAAHHLTVLRERYL